MISFLNMLKVGYLRIEALASKARLVLHKYFDEFRYVKDEYGHPELRIEKTIFRFWIYSSYWRYLVSKTFVKIWTGQPKIKSTYNNNCVNYLTCVIPETGIGHQLTCWNTGLIFSIKYNLKFVHYPLHKFDGVDWENFLGFGDGELLYSQIENDRSIKIVNLPRIRRIDEKDKVGHYILDEIIKYERRKENNMLFKLNPEHFAYDQTATSEIMRKKYWNAREINPIYLNFRENRLNICCHVRRGDIVIKNEKFSDLENLKNRWINNEYFIKIIKYIKSLLDDYNIDIHVFSQGDISSFREFGELENVFYHLDENPFKSFHGMVVADILILSPSSFSYKAGMICKGIKIARYPWWHEIPDNSEWIRCDEEGNFNPQPLMKKYQKI
jgi:hypothetical protein